MVSRHSITRGSSFTIEIMINHAVATVAATVVLFSGKENNLDHDETPLC